MAWDGDDYQARFDRLASRGVDVHGEADFVCSLSPPPHSVLDAGCGTGRVAVELARRGLDVVGVDVDPSMLATARRRAPEIEFVESDLGGLELGRRFDVVLMAGNVLLFTPKGTERGVVLGCARHVASAGALVAGFQLDRGYGLDAYDADCVAAGLGLAERWATWDRQPFDAAPAGTYAVSVYRPVPAGASSPTAGASSPTAGASSPTGSSFSSQNLPPEKIVTGRNLSGRQVQNKIRTSPRLLPDPERCELCEAGHLTTWYHEDEICWIADCEICAVPMVVWKRHGVTPPDAEVAHMIGELDRVAREQFGDVEFTVDRVMRQIKTHFHAHARDRQWWHRRFNAWSGR